MKNQFKFALLILISVLSISLASAQVQDSTKIQAATEVGSACVTVDGVPADGSAGTPKAAPYYGGNWFASVSAASQKFGRALKATAPGVCVTTCPAGQNWNGSAGSCEIPCTAGTSTATQVCPSGYTGNQTQTTTTTCGASGPSSTTFGWDMTQCTPVCTGPTHYTQSKPCPNGDSGSESQTVTTECSGNVTYSGWDTSQCEPPPPATNCTFGAAPAVPAYNNQIYLLGSDELGNVKRNASVSGPAGPTLGFNTLDGTWTIDNFNYSHYMGYNGSTPVPGTFGSTTGNVNPANTWEYKATMSGVWTTTPACQYEFQVVKVSASPQLQGYQNAGSGFNPDFRTYGPLQDIQSYINTVTPQGYWTTDDNNDPVFATIYYIACGTTPLGTYFPGDPSTGAPPEGVPTGFGCAYFQNNSDPSTLTSNGASLGLQPSSYGSPSQFGSNTWTAMPQNTIVSLASALTVGGTAGPTWGGVWSSDMCATEEYQFTINIRPVGNPGAMITTTILLGIDNADFTCFNAPSGP